MSALGLSPASLHAALLASDSATAVLEGFCGGPVLVHRLSPDRVNADPACAARLAIRPDETVTRRHVQLRHGCLVLSEAELWYVAARLPEAMAQRLATGTLPFGRVVRGMGLRRTTLSSRIGAAGDACALEHRAMLADPEGLPIALVHERYGWALSAS